MGIFSKPKKENSEEELKEYKTQSMDGVSTVAMYDINDSMIVQYKNNDTTRIIRGKITKYRGKKDIKNAKDTDYIAFEISKGQKLTPEIIKEAIAEYEEDTAIDKSQRVYYLGRCTKCEYGYYFSYMNKEVEDIVRKLIEEENATKQRQGILSRENNYRASLDARKSIQQASKPIISQRASQQIQTGMEK